MRRLPVSDPGTPDVRSPARFLLWLARAEIRTVVAAASFGMLWMGTLALIPAILGHTIDAGVAHRDSAALLTWSAVLLGAGSVQAGANIMRHRASVMIFLGVAFRTVQLVTRKAVDLGATLPKRIATGEVVSVGTSDIEHLGSAIEIAGRAAGAVTSFVVVAAVLLSSSLTLGLLVVVGVPVLVLCVTPLLRPLHRRQTAHRAKIGELTTLGTDIVAGLRVLRGIGGEQTFAERYKVVSQDVRAAGVRVGKVEAILDAAQVLLPGVFVVILVWIGARFALEGRISIGELVAFYGYAAFLVEPLRNATDVAHRVTRGLVAARRTTRVLALESDLVEPVTPHTAPAGGSLVDPTSGFVVKPGLLTAVASDQPEQAADLADRLGRYVDTDATLGGIRLDAMSRADVRARILVADTEATLFTGRLRAELETSAKRGDNALDKVLGVASADDILDALPDGLDSPVDERGRSFSGGQRQRLLLVRALLADPEVLVLVEPTSAVDAHTEARIAERLRAARSGRTTVVMTTSPLVLDRADTVAYMAGGKVVAEGSHAALVVDAPGYRALVTRGEST